MGMNVHALLKAVSPIAGAIILAACAHDELKVSQGADRPTSKNVTIGTAATSRVDTTAGPKAGAEAQSATHADTSLTPDRSEWRPKMPMIRTGSCPGEDCSYGYLVTACEDLQLLATDLSGAKPTGITVHKGDTATLETGNLHLLEPGIVVMKRDYAITDIVDESNEYKAPLADTLRFFVGDTVYVLDYLELGAWNWWYRGKPGSGDEFWTGVLQRSYGPGDENRPAVSVSRPRGEWWYKLDVDSSNNGGWVRAGRGWWVELNFVRVDSDWKCGGPPGKSDLSGTQ